MVFNEAFVDKAAKQRALIPAHDQVVDVQVAKIFQIVRYELIANFLKTKFDY